MGQAADNDETPSARGLRVAVIAARYNDAIVAQLIAGAQLRWQELGGEAADMRLERVPGAFELPLAARQFALRGQIDAVVALGCVIRGDTAHFEYVAGECARGLQRVMLDTGVPVSFGVLTTESEVQAQQRAAPGMMNKGGEAIATAVAMALLLRRV